MSTTLIGLGYKARSGKDSAAAAIIEARGGEYDIRRYAFADAVKREVEDAAQRGGGGMFALYQTIIAHSPKANVQWDPDPDMTDPLCPSGKQRSILQWWGTEFRRFNDAFYWVRKLKTRVEAEKPQFALITDMRFVNEIAYVKSTGGVTIKVVREGFTGIDLASQQHVSENELRAAEFDYEITVPDGKTEELKADAVQLFDLIVEGLAPHDFAAEELSAA